MRCVPVANDGWRFIIPLVVVGCGLLFVGPAWMAPAGFLFLGASLFCLFFFRDFERRTEKNPTLIYSPGDGRVLEVSKISEGKFSNGNFVRIFLSVFNGHIQRSPVDGKVNSISYKKGRFLDARNPQAHLQNEQNSLIIQSEKGELVVSQIAGLLARRIVCWVKEGEKLEQGQRYGLIRFGSQVDIVMPPQTRVRVKPGDKVLGGKTVLAEWSSQ